MRQQALYVLAFAIPGDKPDHGKGMTEIVQPWLKSGGRGAMDACFFAQSLVDKFRSLAENPLVLNGSE